MLAGVLLPHTYQVSKYDPADRDERGRYLGLKSPRSDHGPLDGTHAALVVPTVGEPAPLLIGVLPDPDGVLRARWMPWLDDGR